MRWDSESGGRTYGRVSSDGLGDGLKHDDNEKLTLSMTPNDLLKYNNDGELDVAALERRILAIERALAKLR